MGLFAVDRRSARREIKKLQSIKTWQLLVILVLSGFMTATFFRLNNIGMIERRSAVLAADESGDQAATTARLYDLQRYVATHMNTDTGPIYLEHQYRRDAQRSVDAAKNAGNPNGNINEKAEAVCKPQYTVWSTAYVQCFTDELAKYPPSPDPVQNITLPRTDLYRHAFAAPLWSPDFAGWSLLVNYVIVTIIFGRLISLGLLRLILKYRLGGV